LAWQLAESGIMVPVGGSPVQVTADDQALLVLPQTTQNPGNDAKADPSDFYLEVTYTVGNITETIPAYFNDINKLTPDNNQGLTFEMGRQYAINVSITATGLSFGLVVKIWDEPPATQFVVNFDANGGTGAATEDLLLWEAGVPYDITVPNNPYYGPLDVYYFLGWSTDPDGIKKSKSTGTLYLPGETISGVTGSMTLYAQWSKPHQTTLDFAFTGMPQFVGIVRNGNFRLEAWGAAGGSQYNQTDYTSGRGGYAAGTLNLLIGDILYVYAGGKGTYVPPETKASNPGGWNGGGPSYKWGGSHYHHASGGGATDFRLINGTWDNSEGLHSRFLVAGGGGAIADYDYNNSNGYAYGGGETGGSTRLNTSNSMGGTQIAGGEGGERGGWGKGISGSFGAGGYLIGDQNCCAGGGGGWYGGGNGPSGGGGGSGFTYTGQEVTTPSAYQVTLKYILSNTSSINGISSMPDYTKTDGLPYMTGNTGDGYARITYLGQ
jgi:hypothetical protein